MVAGRYSFHRQSDVGFGNLGFGRVKSFPRKFIRDDEMKNKKIERRKKEGEKNENDSNIPRT